jgi:hypothetical protein
MHRLAFFTLGRCVALASAAVVLVALTGARGLFSPGALSERQHGASSSGLTSHAAIGNNCAACHAAPWSSATMSARCLECHRDVRRQLDAGAALHGRMPEGAQCRRCHTEHNGPHASLTNLARFDHDWTPFPLSGRHKTADCRACHASGVYQGTAQTCVGCHAEPAAHQGRFGTDCARCHTTLTWTGASFRHSFPLNHGRGRRGSNSCAICHPAADDFRVYTCYGCHQHRPDNTERKHLRHGIVDFEQCAKCHTFGRKNHRKKEKFEIRERDFVRERE